MQLSRLKRQANFLHLVLHCCILVKDSLRLIIQLVICSVSLADAFLTAHSKGNQVEKLAGVVLPVSLNLCWNTINALCIKQIVTDSQNCFAVFVSESVKLPKRVYSKLTFQQFNFFMMLRLKMLSFSP